MIFNSEIFLLFALLFFPLYFVMPTARAQNMLTLAGSYLFYGWWDWRFLFLIGFTTVANFYITRLIVRPGGRKFLWLAVATNLIILGFFKYFGFFVDQFIAVSQAFGIQASRPTLQIILPVGISFFTFQAMSYVIDAARGKIEPTPSLLRFATYIALFPQLVAGPIVRAARLLPQLERRHGFSWPSFWIGMEKVLIGATMKVVIADRLAPLVDRTFDVPETYNGLGLLLGVFLFAIQIYGDFAGYSLIAIGLGRIMGYDFPINFRRPYLSRSFSEFWRRWHISLSTWLRDYLYISLGGNRGGTLKTWRNLMATMVLGGLWHGAGWPFVIWGTLHGLYLILQRVIVLPLSSARLTGLARYAWVWACRTGVILAVCLAWVFFRAESFGDAMTYLGGIATSGDFSPGPLPNKFQLGLALLLVAIFLVLEVGCEDSAVIRRLRWKRPVRIVFALALIIALPLLGTFSGNAFVYFQF